MRSILCGDHAGSRPDDTNGNIAQSISNPGVVICADLRARDYERAELGLPIITDEKWAVAWLAMMTGQGVRSACSYRLKSVSAVLTCPARRSCIVARGAIPRWKSPGIARHRGVSSVLS